MNANWGKTLNRREQRKQGQAGLGTSMGNGVLEYWSVGGRFRKGRKSAQKCAKVRENPRTFTKVRTDQARKYSIVRIVTGETFFWPRMELIKHGFGKRH